MLACLCLLCLLVGCAAPMKESETQSNSQLTVEQQQAAIHQSSESDITQYIDGARAWGMQEGRVWGWGLALAEDGEPLQDTVGLVYTQKNIIFM